MNSAEPDWPTLHQQAVDRFARGWEHPHPHAWDDLITEGVELVQPFLRSGNGSALWYEEVARLRSFAPDLHAVVLDWAGNDELLMIHLEFRLTAGGKPLSFRAIDHIQLDLDGRILRRESFFDAWAVMLRLLRRPRSWGPWWRSGIGPLTSRRRLQRRWRTA